MTNLYLDHVCSLSTHLTNKIENVHRFRCFNHIQHCKYSNKSASSTHASTKIEHKIHDLDITTQQN